ncbi:MAG: hypothetical protein WA972_05805 [Rhodococcus qingshengii]
MDSNFVIIKSGYLKAVTDDSIRGKIMAVEVYVKELNRLVDEYNNNKSPGGIYLQDVRHYIEELRAELK